MPHDKKPKPEAPAQAAPEQGHMIANELGGAGDAANLAPQSAGANDAHKAVEGAMDSKKKLP